MHLPIHFQPPLLSLLITFIFTTAVVTSTAHVSSDETPSYRAEFEAAYNPGVLDQSEIGHVSGGGIAKDTEREVEIDSRDMASKASLNVFKSPLSYFGGSPIKTGFLRNGYCEVPAGDFGNHAVAAEVTDEFLAFSAAQGNDLRTIGLKGGCKWCLCVSRWREAFDARKNDQDPIVPKVFLSATNEKALGKVSLEEFKKFAAKEE